MRSHLSFSLTGAVLVALLCTSCSAIGDDAQQTTRGSVTWQGLNRTFDYHVPHGVGDAEEVPLILAFHGAGDTGTNFAKGSGLNELADLFGFVVAYPNSTGVNWAEGCNCIRPDLDGVDDVGFADQVIEYLDDRLAVDRDRIMAVGYSQGAIFAHRLACERADVYAGMASVSGMMNLPVSQQCNIDAPIDIFMMHGRQDPVLPYNGISGTQATLSVPATFALWRGLNGCADGTDQQDFSEGGYNWDVFDARSCDENARLRLSVAANAGHEWISGSAGAARRIVNFLILGQ